METQPQIVMAGAAEVIPLLSLAMGDDVQGLGLAAIIDGCQLFKLENGPAEFAYALKPQGGELWIQAAGGRGAVDLTAFGLAIIEQQAAGVFRSVGFQTRRRGLLKKALKAGYKLDGFILRKNV